MIPKPRALSTTVEQHINVPQPRVVWQLSKECNLSPAAKMQSYRQFRSLKRQVAARLDTHQPLHGDPSEHEENEPDVEAAAGSVVPPEDGLTADRDVDELEPAATRLERAGTRLGVAMTGIDVRSRTTIEDRSLGKVFVVGFYGPDDTANPQNWSFAKRSVNTLNVALVAGVVGLASAIDSAALPQMAAAYGVSDVAENLATGLFLAGIGFGAFLFGPLSETVGRNPVYMVSVVIMMLFIMGSGLSLSLGAQLTCRFFAGFFGGAPFSVLGGSLADMWTPTQRMVALPVTGFIGFLGPVVGPPMGGFIAQSDAVSWRWVEWTSLIATGLVLASFVLFQSETYAPILLKWKAEHLRRATGDDRYVSTAEIRAMSFVQRLKVSLSRPFAMTLQEPTIMLWTAYLTIIYVMLFGFLAGYSFVFQEPYRISQGITGLLFLAIAVGYVFAVVPLNWLVYRWAQKAVAEHREKNPNSPDLRLAPEFRLWYAMLGAPAIPISLFWMGWTAYPGVSIWSPILASTLFGYGVLAIYFSTYQYLIESYEAYAASALTMISLVRYVVSGGTTVAMIPIYRSIGIHWTLTWLALVGVVFTPAPFLFYRYGKAIRSRSRFAYKG